MNYRIIAADAALGQINVTYFNDKDEPIGTYVIDVPVIDGAFITGTALEELIQSRAPTWVLERTNEITTADNFSEIVSLVDTSYVSAQAAESAAAEPLKKVTVIETPKVNVTTTVPTVDSTEKTSVTLV